MDRALELVASGLQRRDVNRLDLLAGKVLHVVNLLAACVEDVDVVVRPDVLVVECELEAVFGRRREGGLVELHARCRDLDATRGGPAGPTGAARWSGRPTG